MCFCNPKIRTPNCGSVACTAAAEAAGRVQHGERADVLAHLRAEAARFRNRNEGADAVVSAHVEILADQIERAEHRGARHRTPHPPTEKGNPST